MKNTWGLLENLEIFENYWGGVENNSFVIYMQGLRKDFELKGSKSFHKQWPILFQFKWASNTKILHFLGKNWHIHEPVFKNWRVYLNPSNPSQRNLWHGENKTKEIPI